MGHGVRSALVVAMIRGLMEKASHHADRPANFLRKMNKGLCRILGSTDVDMFATACYIVADFNVNTLRIASAGHDLPLLVDKKSGALLDCDVTKGPALGFFDDAVFESQIYKLDTISEALLYTDGIYESADKQGVEWGKEQFFKSFFL